MFQSPQWGKCSKDGRTIFRYSRGAFQSPQWGKCSKGAKCSCVQPYERSFSPRNGESVLKQERFMFDSDGEKVSVPAMGKVF